MREINLIGQDTTCYGEDLGLKDGLATLLARLAQIETPHEKWIRFLYAYPNKVTQKLLDTIAEHPALVKYIDMPLQHASAPVLKRMKRGASGDIFLKLIERIRRTIPGVAIRTSMIVGFPGETDAGFRRAVPVRAKPRSSTGWACSPIPTKTPARSFQLDGKVDARTIYNRKRRLMAIQRKISQRAQPAHDRRRRFRCWWKGLSKETDLLWEGAHVDAGARDRRRHADQRFRRRRAAARARSARCASPKRTTTIWWARCCRRRAAATARCATRRLVEHFRRCMKCPICKKEVHSAIPEIPFCSERCRLIDLGNWASGKYVIPGAPVRAGRDPSEE